MSTLVLKQDLTVAEGEVKTFDQGDFFISTGVLVGWYESTVGEVYFEPSITNYGEIYLGPTQTGAASLFHFNTGMHWTTATFRNYGLISAVAPTDYGVTALFAGSRSPHVFNAGTIIASAIDDAIGFENWGSNLVTNAATGTISVKAAERVLGIYLPSGREMVIMARSLRMRPAAAMRSPPTTRLALLWAAGTLSACRLSPAA